MTTLINLISEFDKWLLLLINSHHSPSLDRIMWFASGIANWFPLYIFILLFLIFTYKKQSWLLILLIFPLIVISDQLSSEIIKPLVHRLRPSHEPGLENLLHYVNSYHGGPYGFVSSHACNFFAVATYLTLTASKKIRWLPLIMFPVVLLVIYSRAYLGVHYPSDIAAGGLLGIFLGWLTAKIYYRFCSTVKKIKDETIYF
jgi:undecaprenyl-diphosphatase